MLTGCSSRVSQSSPSPPWPFGGRVYSHEPTIAEAIKTTCTVTSGIYSASETPLKVKKRFPSIRIRIRTQIDPSKLNQSRHLTQVRGANCLE